MPVWLYVAAFLVGSYMQYDETKKTAKRTQQAIEEGYRRQSEKNKERRERIMSYAEDTVDQQRQNEVLDEFQKEQEQSIVQNVNERVAAIPGTDSYSGAGKISTDSQELADSAKLDTLKTLSDMAALQSKTRGFGDLDFYNAWEEKGMGGDIAGINTEANIMGDTDALLTKLASQPDQRKMFAAGLLQQLGMMGTMNSMGTTGPSPTATPSAAQVGPAIPTQPVLNSRPLPPLPQHRPYVGPPRPIV